MNVIYDKFFITFYRWREWAMQRRWENRSRSKEFREKLFLIFTSCLMYLLFFSYLLFLWEKFSSSRLLRSEKQQMNKWIPGGNKSILKLNVFSILHQLLRKRETYCISYLCICDLCCIMYFLYSTHNMWLSLMDYILL